MTKSFSVKSSHSHSGQHPRSHQGQLNFWDEALVLMKALKTDWSDLATLKWLPIGVGTVGTLFLWRFNGTLLLTLLIAMAIGGVTYSLVEDRKHTRWRKLLKLLQKGQNPLGISIGVGILTLALSYSTITVWQDLRSPSLAFMLLTQEVGLLVIMGLVLWSVLHRSPAKPELVFERCVAGLLHRDELRRLMAVRQLAQMKQQDLLSPQQQSMAVEYLELLLPRESNPTIIKAIQENLILTRPYPQLGESSSVTERVLHQPLAVKNSQRAIVNSLMESVT